MKTNGNYNVQVLFETYNGYGNNLYLDNISIGRPLNNDASIISISNIPKDTTYTAGINKIKITPEVVVINSGINILNSVDMTMTIEELGYSSSYVLSSLNPRKIEKVIFDSLEIFTGIPFTVNVFLNCNSDSVSVNDTLIQNTLLIQGYTRNILIEEWTSATSLSCAINNPFLDRFIDSNFQKIVPVKYHTGFPPPGNDSMYLSNPVQSDQRKNYYYISSVPTTIIDGIAIFPPPYDYDTTLKTIYSDRSMIGTPLSINITDTLITADTMSVNIDITINNNLKYGNYSLRVFAIERDTTYQNPPGNNSEKYFPDVFLLSATDSAGININTASGTYHYNVKYAVSQYWNTNKLYTACFVQNNDTREIINSNKSRIIPHQNFNRGNGFYPRANFIDKTVSNYRNAINNNIKIQTDSSGSTVFHFEIFESNFPPEGWQIVNYDKFYTFEEMKDVNGPDFDGTKCTRIPFYFYSLIGQKDILASKVFQNVTSSDTLQFDYAYAQYLSSFIDSLIVKISIDGGTTYSTIFSKGGMDLATAPSTTLPFTPSNPGEWKKYIYPLSNILPPQKNIPEDFKLYQNFPNPFNAITKIKFSIRQDAVGKMQYVHLKIFDLLGREIQTLINEQMYPGTYEVTFDGTNYASGIYFYRLTINEFITTKKMVLVK
jgi:hypothetical protein